MVKLDEINSTSTFAWSHDCLPILAAGTVAGAVDINFNSSSSLELWDIFSPTNNKEPIFSAAVDNRFYSLAWSPSFDNRSHGILAAAFENGIIEFWDVATLIKSKDLSKASIFKSSKHSGAVRTLSFNPKQPHILVSGGSKGEIFIWDTKTFDEPTVPGTAMTPMDEITSVAWNNSVSHIMASTSNGGYTSIWDLKSKREVLHLSYSGELGRANFSYVAWHPTQSTKLITASDSDSCPLILTWDLRNSNAPEKVMKGHKKGVLSLDWCKQDPELLISSGKDNSTMLWNPITGEKLGEYPTTANWAFLTKFAPQAPDIFATASFDGKIVIQSLQDTSPPVSTNVTTNDDEFWNEISTTDTQQPTFDIKQAPAWLKRPSNVSFGFGSKLVTIKKDQDGKSSTVEIKKFVTKGNLQKDSEKISKAFESNDFSDIINERLNDERFINNVDKSDWQLLKKLSSNDKKILFTDAIKDDGDDDKSGKVESNGKSGLEDDVKDGNTEASTDNGAVEDSFFDKLGEANNDTSKITSPIYVPTGEFKIFSSKSSDNDKKLIKLILNNKINEAVENCLENDKLTEALVLSLDSSNEVKDKVRNAFFNKSKDSEFARVLYSASSKNVTDLISNGNVEDWKLIANSISSFAKDDEDFNNKITELGDRILTSNKNNRDDAILCYLAGGSIDKIANIWLKELPTLEKTLLEDANNKNISSPSDARFEALNNFAEKIVSYKSLSKITGALSGPSIEPICKVVLEYVNLLAGFGQFEVADQFLKLLPDDFDGSKTEKDRISKATAKAVPAQTSKNLNSRAGARNTQYSRSNTATNNVNQANIPASPLNNVNIRPPVAPVNQFTQQQPITPGFRPIAPPAANNSTIAPPSSNGAHGLGNGASIVGAPVAPTANPYAKSSNPYAPSGHNSNPYMKPEPTVLSPPPNNLSINGNAPPPKPSYKQETDGWNDLPDTFKPKTAPRRAVGGGSVVSPSQTPFQSHSPAPPSISKRPSLASAPTTSSIPSSVPPKGPSRTASRANLTSPRQVHAQPRYPQPPSGPQTPSNPPVNNPYAPQVPPSTAAPVNNPYAPPPTAANTAPVNNPYAPPPTAANTAPVAPSIGAPAFSPAPGLPINSPRLSHAAPVKNPYAPPPASTSSATAGSGPQSRVSSGGIVPPPKASIPPPPASGISSISGPPPNGPSISNQPPAQSPSQPPPVTASKTQTKYPSGDRSHISAESLPIYEIFDSTYQALKPKIPERFVKHGEDMEKRLNILFDHLNNDDLLSKEAVEALKEVATSLKNKDYSNASSSILAFASSFPEEIGNWHVGVKRLVQMDEALV